MEAKQKIPLWITITFCIMNIAGGLFQNASTAALFQPIRNWDCINKYFEGSNEGSTKVPAIVGIIICDLLLILFATLPKKTFDQCIKTAENMGCQTHIACFITSLVSFKFIFRQIISSDVLPRDVVMFSNLKPQILDGLKPTKSTH